MHFDVEVINDDDLPHDYDFCFVRLPDRWVYVVKRSRAASPRVMREAWAVARTLVVDEPELLESA